MEESTKQGAVKRLRELADALERGDKGQTAIIITAHEGRLHVSAVGHLGPRTTKALLEGLKKMQGRLVKHLASVTKSRSLH